MTFFNLVGISNALSVSQAAQGDMTRRGFLAAMGGLTALTVAGCGTSETNPDAHPHPGGDGGSDFGTDAGVPTSFQVEANFAALPSHYPSSLRLLTDRVVGVGTAGGGEPGDRNHLFDFDPASATRPIPSSPRLELPATDGRFLNHLAKRPTGSRAVLTANDGLYDLLLGAAPTQRYIAFPSGNNFAGGAVYAGDKLFVAAANATVNGDGTMTFGTGRVLVYSLSGSGVIQESTMRSIPTTGKNPTGLALRGGSTLVVLNSGPFGAGARASLDLIDVATESVTRTIDLGTFTGQVSAEVALTEDGNMAVIGSADDSRLTVVDLNSGFLYPTTLPGTQFHSSVKIDDDLGILYVTDFNAGSVTVLNLATRAIIQSLLLGSGEAGPSEIYDGALIQSIPYGAVRVYPA